MNDSAISASPAVKAAEGSVLRLAYSPPYAWDEILAFFAARAVDGVEQVTNDTYVRSMAVAGTSGVIAVAPSRPGELRLRVHGSRPHLLPHIINRVRRMFDLGVDPTAVNTHLRRDDLLAPLVAARPGLRVAGAWDGFELATRAILGQQITVTAARHLASRLTARYGQPLDGSLGQIYPGVTRLFPTSLQLAAADSATLGMPRARAAALVGVARAVARDPGVLLQASSLDESVRTLRSLPGIGEWTAQYIAMRQHREPDAFPATDVALLRAVGQRLGRRVSPAELLAHSERWRPWRAYGAAHLWASLQIVRNVRLE